MSYKIVKVFATILVVSLLASGYAIYSASLRGHRVNARQNSALRTFICFFQETVLLNRKQTPQQRAFALHFFNASLDKIHAKHCQLTIKG